MRDDNADWLIVGALQGVCKVPFAVFGYQHAPEAIGQVSLWKHEGFLRGYCGHKPEKAYKDLAYFFDRYIANAWLLYC